MTLDVPLREYIERRLSDRSEIVNVRFELQATALELQAKEVERRFEQLNHIHQQSDAVLATYVPRADYNAEMGALQKWRQEIDAWKNRMIGIAVGSAAGGGMLGALLTRLFASPPPIPEHS